MARYNKRTSKATKAALKTRGGFGRMPGFYVPINRYVMVNANTFVAKYMKDMAMGYAKSKVDPKRVGIQAGAWVERKLSQLKDTRVSVDIEGTKYQKITTNDHVVSGSTTNDSVSSTRETVSVSKNNAIRIGREHKTTFKTGKPTSATIRRVGKNNGVNEKTNTDTRVTLKSGNDRRDLTVDWGFNQKGYAAYGSRSYWTMSDLDLYYQVLARVTDDDTNDQRAYGHMHELKTEYTMTNTNSYLKATVKVHWCSLAASDVDPTTAFFNCFNQDPLSPTGDQTGKYPVNRQLGFASNPNTRAYATVDPVRGNLNSSERFENTFQIKHTMTKTLNPGDVWTIKHHHSCGSGVRLDLLRYFVDLGNLEFNSQQPVSLFPIFEYKGPLVDAVSVDSPGNRYTGSAPGGIQHEFRKVAKIGMSSNAIWWGGGTTGGFDGEKYGVSVYSDPDPAFDQDSSTTKVFNVPVSNLSYDGTGAGKFYIPVTTDDFVRFGGPS